MKVDGTDVDTIVELLAKITTEGEVQIDALRQARIFNSYQFDPGIEQAGFHLQHAE